MAFNLWTYYLLQDGYCHANKSLAAVNLASYTNVTAYDQEALKFAISAKGPVSVGIDASHMSLSFYADGVYYEPACGKVSVDGPLHSRKYPRNGNIQPPTLLCS